jgi:sugar/nucleoside kinase (ribokinase family)
MNIKKAKFDVSGIGSALLDFMVDVDDAFLQKLGLTKGGMQLIDENRSREIFSLIAGMNIQTAPGGSSANTVAGVATLGGKGAFIGRVADDEYGRVYIRKTEDSGVFSLISAGDGLTGHAITFITPDSERTFATHLGAALRLSHEDVDYSAIADSSILHLEGYLFEPENLREICYKAMDTARQNGVLISVDLADPGLIGRIGDVFTDLLNNYADIVFMNEEEAHAFTGSRDKAALEKIPARCGIVIVKLGEKGSIIRHSGGITEISSYKTDVVNTNGAGDMYAAGVLYGITSGRTIESAGKIGSCAASVVVASVGARAEKKIDLKGII